MVLDLARGLVVETKKRQFAWSSGSIQHATLKWRPIRQDAPTSGPSRAWVGATLFSTSAFPGSLVLIIKDVVILIRTSWSRWLESFGPESTRHLLRVHGLISVQGYGPSRSPATLGCRPVPMGEMPVDQRVECRKSPAGPGVLVS